MPQFRWRFMRGGPGRPPKHRIIRMPPGNYSFIPIAPDGTPVPGPPVQLLPDEYEALRLVYLEGLKQEEAAKMMGVSRGTLWRALQSGRRKLVEAIVHKRPIVLVSVE